MVVQQSRLRKLIAAYVPFCRALCEPSRVDLLALLLAARRPCTVSELAARLPVDMSVVSRHLSLMRDAGVLRAEKRGREIHYSVQGRTLARMLRAIADLLDPQADNEEATP